MGYAYLDSREWICPCYGAGPTHSKAVCKHMEVLRNVDGCGVEAVRTR